MAGTTQRAARRLTSPIWNALLRRGLEAIRAADPTRTVVVGPVAQNDVAALEDLDLPPDPNLVAAVHYYAPMRFTHQGAHWVNGAASWLGTTWDGTDAERAAVTTDSAGCHGVGPPERRTDAGRRVRHL